MFRVIKASGASRVAGVGVVACLLLATIVSALWAQTSRFGRWRVDITATPKRVHADGKMAATIRVEIRDSQGLHAPDGTTVICHTDLGRLSLGETDKRATLNVETRGGFAIVYVSSDQPGTAQLRVQVGDSYNHAYVAFLPEGEPLGRATRVIEVRGGWVGYSVDLNTIEARDCATAKYGALRVEAEDILQINIDTMVLKGWPAVFSRGDQQLEGEFAYYEIYGNKAAMQRITDEGIEVASFDTLGLTPRDEEWQLPDDALRLDNRETQTWLVCKSASIFVGEKIVLRHGVMYVQGQKVLSFPPYWIIGLPGYSGSTSTQTLALSSGGGVAVDFPWYYRVTNSATGAIKLQRGAEAGSVIAREGWTLALEEEYGQGDVEGRITVAGLPRSDWGVEWEDRRRLFGGALADFSIGWPDHHSLFVDANIFDQWPSGRVNLRGYYQAPEDIDASYGLDADWLSNPKPFLGGRNASYRLGTSVAARRGPAYNGTVIENELYAALDLRPWRIGSKTDLRPSFSDVYAWDTADFSANSANGRLRLKHEFSNSLWSSLQYSAEYVSGDAYHTGWRQVLDLDLGAYHGAKWDAHLSAQHDLTASDTYASLYTDYYLDSRWRLGLWAAYYDFDGTSYDDVELELGRRVFNREIGLCYSFETGRLALELAGLVGPGY